MVTSLVSSCQHEDEPPQDLRPGASGEKSLSKSALKNQRKREAKKAAKQVRLETDTRVQVLKSRRTPSHRRRWRSNGSPALFLHQLLHKHYTSCDIFKLKAL